MKTRSGVTLYLPRYSMEQGSTAVCPATTVTFTIGTSKAGSKPTTNNTRARHVIICQLNIDNIRMGFSNDPHHWYTAIDYKHYSMILRSETKREHTKHNTCRYTEINRNRKYQPNIHKNMQNNKNSVFQHFQLWRKLVHCNSKQLEYEILFPIHAQRN